MEILNKNFKIGFPRGGRDEVAIQKLYKYLLPLINFTILIESQIIPTYPAMLIILLLHIKLIEFTIFRNK